MSSSPFRLIAVDLDGTLLARSGDPHGIDVDALRRASHAGVIVTIITGRLVSGTLPAARALGLTGPIACADGSHLIEAERASTLVHHGIEFERAAVLREALRTHGLATFVFKHDTIIHDDRGDVFRPYIELWSNDIQRSDNVLDHEIFIEGDLTAIVALGSEEQVHMAVAEISAKVKEPLNIATFAIAKLGTLWGLIIRSDVATKGTALRWLAEHHGLSLAETVCVGDWINDVPMLNIAGRSFAMGQAPESVRSVATDVLEETAHAGGGIARVVRDVFGV